MLFTGADVMNYARDRSARGESVTLDPHLEARQINDLIRSAIMKIVAIDPERLEEPITIPTADVTADDEIIDLTSSATVEWLKINAIDWRSAVDGAYEGEVVIATREARHRASWDHDWLGSPVGYFTDRQRSIRKVAGWDGVYDLLVYGVTKPTELDPRDAQGFQRVFDYPEPMFRAVCCGYLMRVATRLNPSEMELQIWGAEATAAWQDMEEDAQNFVDQDLRIEDVPHQEFGA